MSPRRVNPVSPAVPPANRELVLRLRGLCGESGLTYAQLAELTRTSVSSLSRFLGGSRLPAEDALNRLFQVLGVEPEEQRQLTQLWRRALDERHRPGSTPGEQASAATGLRTMLEGLREAAGRPSLRRIAALTDGLSTTTVHRVLRAPEGRPALVVPVARALTRLLPETADRDRALDSVREAVSDAFPGPPPTVGEWSRTVRNLLAHSAELERQLAERLSTGERDALLADSRRSAEEARAVLRRAHQQDEGESPGTTSPAVRAVRPLAEAGDDRGEDGGRPGRPAPRSGSLERREARRGEEWVVRPVAGAGGKAYRCPGCDQEIAPGVPHVVVSLADGNVDDRRHWHTACWNAQDRRTGKLRRSAPSSLRHPL